MTLPFSSVGINTSVGYLSSVGSKAKYFIWRLLHGELSAHCESRLLHGKEELIS